MRKQLNEAQNRIKASFNNRREFLKKGVAIGALTGISGAILLTGCREESSGEVTPAEDLMREHGVLNRVMLIYDNIRTRIATKEQFSPEILNESALIIRNFIENYHEKLEENFLFPRFESAGILKDLVEVLKIQHQAGRKVTDEIIKLAKSDKPDDFQKLQELLISFNSMYRPHEAREDTVLFPAIKKIITGDAYVALGEDFEDKEHELLGENGFEGMVEKVSGIEKQLGIYDLARFTPILQ